MPGLSKANRHFATLVFLASITFESLDEFVELIDLLVQGGQFHRQTGFVFDFLGLVESTPVNLNRFIGPQLIGKALTPSP